MLLLFIAAQVSVIHEFSHDDDAQECEVCLIAHDFQSQSFDTAVSVSYELTAPTNIKDRIVVSFAFAKADSQLSTYTTRPPPIS